MTLKIGAGRSLESREAVGEMLFALIKTHFAALMASRYLALSFELDELHPTLNYKQNNVHALFKYVPSPFGRGLGEGSRPDAQALSHGEREKTNVKQDIAMLDKHTHTLIAHRLHQAEQSREQIRQISLDYPTITIDDAYAVQREWVSLKIAEGRVLKGHKIGLTSKAMQASSQISEPDYGALLDDMFFHDGSDIPVDRFIVPRIEVELAFVLAKPLRGPNCTIFDVYNATDYVIPALELIDARCHNVDPETQRPRKVFDTISDNAANAG
jgi:2-oxo-hept-3-ene-1,7-dioate hydratase